MSTVLDIAIVTSALTGLAFFAGWMAGNDAAQRGLERTRTLDVAAAVCGVGIVLTVLSWLAVGVVWVAGQL